MTPTIVMKNSKPYIIVGTPGGTTIPTSVYQSIVNVIDFKLNPNMAVNTPKFHHQWLPEIVEVTTNFPETSISDLEKKNYIFYNGRPCMQPLYIATIVIKILLFAFFYCCTATTSPLYLLSTIKINTGRIVNDCFSPTVIL